MNLMSAYIIFQALDCTVVMVTYGKALSCTSDESFPFMMMHMMCAEHIATKPTDRYIFVFLSYGNFLYCVAIFLTGKYLCEGSEGSFTMF